MSCLTKTVYKGLLKTNCKRVLVMAEILMNINKLLCNYTDPH